MMKVSSLNSCCDKTLFVILSHKSTTMKVLKCNIAHKIFSSFWCISICTNLSLGCIQVIQSFSSFQTSQIQRAQYVNYTKSYFNKQKVCDTSLEDSSIWSFKSLIFFSNSSKLLSIIMRCSSIWLSSNALCSSLMHSGVCRKSI